MLGLALMVVVVVVMVIGAIAFTWGILRDQARLHQEWVRAWQARFPVDERES